MEDTGKKAVSYKLFWRQFRYVGRNVSVQAQNKALVFCCGDACDIYITGGCRKVAVSLIVLIRDVVRNRLFLSQKSELAGKEDLQVAEEILINPRL